jgi:hypothetical protein
MISFHLPLVPQDHEQDLQSVPVDQHRGGPWRKMPGSLEQGAATSSPQWAGSDGFQSPRLCPTPPMAVAQQMTHALEAAAGERRRHHPVLLRHFHKLHDRGWPDNIFLARPMAGWPMHRRADARAVGCRPDSHQTTTNGDLCPCGARLDSRHHRLPHDSGSDPIPTSSPAAEHYRPFAWSGR